MSRHSNHSKGKGHFTECSLLIYHSSDKCAEPIQIHALPSPLGGRLQTIASSSRGGKTKESDDPEPEFTCKWGNANRRGSERSPVIVSTTPLYFVPPPSPISKLGYS